MTYTFLLCSATCRHTSSPIDDHCLRGVCVCLRCRYAWSVYCLVLLLSSVRNTACGVLELLLFVGSSSHSITFLSSAALQPQPQLNFGSSTFIVPQSTQQITLYLSILPAVNICDFFFLIKNIVGPGVVVQW